MTQPTVLVVEDEPAQREVLAYNLGAEGFAVLTAATGGEAELIVAETPPDVILLDWMLPEVTGIELDTLAETAQGLPGVLGARMTGAGFGGSPGQPGHRVES